MIASPQLPPLNWPPLTSFALHTTRPLGQDECVLILNSGTAPSPLVGHASLMLDIDVAREKNVPNGDDGLFDLLNRMRGHKNNIFESCITPRARELFNS